MIKCARLITGEDIITGVDEIDSNSLFLFKKPAVVLMVPTQEGRIQIRMIPFIPFAEKKDFEIPRSVVAFFYEPSVELQNEYNTRYGSGIVIPQIDTRKVLSEA